MLAAQMVCVHEAAMNLLGVMSNGRQGLTLHRSSRIGTRSPYGLAVSLVRKLAESLDAVWS